MKIFKDMFDNLDKMDLKIMTYGLKLCFLVLLMAIGILTIYLFFVHNIFLYELGLLVFKLSTYVAVEFIVCGFVADTVKKQMT